VLIAPGQEFREVDDRACPPVDLGRAQPVELPGPLAQPQAEFIAFERVRGAGHVEVDGPADDRVARLSRPAFDGFLLAFGRGGHVGDL
jgi:hypothetical protein